MLLEGLIQPLHQRKILLDVGDEDSRLILTHEAHSALTTRYEFSQAVDLHRRALCQCGAEHSGDVVGQITIRAESPHLDLFAALTRLAPAGSPSSK